MKITKPISKDRPNFKVLKTMEYLTRGCIPDGYQGDMAIVDFYWDKISGRVIACCENGMFTYHTPPAIDPREAIWLLKNHPSSNADLGRVVI